MPQNFNCKDNIAIFEGQKPPEDDDTDEDESLKVVNHEAKIKVIPQN